MGDNTFRLEELIGQGDPPVRVRNAYHTNVSRHDHDFYELVYVTDGFCLHDAYDEISLLMEGDAFILKPGVEHRYTGNRVTRIYNCIFREEALAGQLEALKKLPGLGELFSRDLTERVPRLHLNLGERKACQRLLEEMFEECQQRLTGWEIRLSAMLASLLVEFSRGCEARMGEGGGATAYSGYVTQALSLIDADYADPALSVRELAARVGVSADYLSRQFRQVLGIAAQEYIRRYRFARAMELLQAGQSVGEVSGQVGFSSLSHFSREFRKEMGMTPSGYRRKNSPTRPARGG